MLELCSICDIMRLDNGGDNDFLNYINRVTFILWSYKKQKIYTTNMNKMCVPL